MSNREILYRGKRIDNDEWVEGYYCKRKSGHYTDIGFQEEYKDCIIKEFSDGGIIFCDVDPETVCLYANKTDKNEHRVFEGDICDLFDNAYNANLIGVVKFGEYNQDGSGGEYLPTPVIGFYVEIIKWKYMEDSSCDDEKYAEWCRTISLLEAMDRNLYDKFEIIGNIFDNPELVGMDESQSKQGIEENSPNDGWIPCSEHLPEEPKELPTEERFIEQMILDDKLEEYIVAVCGAEKATTLYYVGAGRWYDIISSEYYKVAAWQPLPAGYLN